MTDLCPVCESQLNDHQRNPGGRDVTIFSCSICGDFTLSNTLVADLPSTKKGKNDANPMINRAIRNMQESNKGVELYTTTLGKTLENSLPKPKEQADIFSWVRPKKA
jgi:hypothetical protein